jgi:hypothetical protein
VRKLSYFEKSSLLLTWPTMTCNLLVTADTRLRDHRSSQQVASETAFTSSPVASISNMEVQPSSSIEVQQSVQRHSLPAFNSTFVIDSVYQYLQEFQAGAYGCTIAARHRVSGENCLIRKTTNVNSKVRFCV